MMGGNADAAATVEAGSAQANPYDTPSVCTSDEYYSAEDEDADADEADEAQSVEEAAKDIEGSPLMHPGAACITCHRTSDDAPAFTLAGTVYPTAHEPTDCNGVDGSVAATVEITGSDGVVISLPVNDAGNFFSTRRVALPFRAKVIAGGRERAMGAAQMTGDCNGCHTETGLNGAPGRIMLP